MNDDRFDPAPPLLAAPDDAPPRAVLAYALLCARAWDPSARILGNLRAGDLARAIESLAPDASMHDARPPCSRDAPCAPCVATARMVSAMQRYAKRIFDGPLPVREMLAIDAIAVEELRR